MASKPGSLHAARFSAFGLSWLAYATYYLGRETFLATPKGKMGTVSESLFSYLSRNSVTATSYFAIPSEQVVELGSQIDL